MVKRPSLTIAHQRDELIRKLVELIDDFNRLAVQVDGDPLVTLQTGLRARANIGGAKTLARVMLGPAANVGATLVFANFVGRNGAGAIAVAQLAVGDVVTEILVTAPGAVAGSAKVDFEATVTVAGQLQQSSASNLTAQTYLIVVERRSATGSVAERPLYLVP